MRKMIQNQQEKERVVSKSRPTVVNMFFVATSLSAALNPIATKSSGMPIVKPDSRMSTEPNSIDASSTSKVRLKDAYIDGLLEKQRGPSHQEEEDSEDSDFSATGILHNKEERVAQNNKAWKKPFPHGVSFSVDKKSQKNTEATRDHYLHISQDTSHYMEAVFSMYRKIYGKPLDEPMKDLNVNLTLWGKFMNTTFRAAVHLGKDNDTNLRFVKNYFWKTTRLHSGNRKAEQLPDQDYWDKID